MDFEEFLRLDTLKQREIAYYRKQFEAFDNLATIVEQNKEIIKLLNRSEYL